jgi:hypothetical protein
MGDVVNFGYAPHDQRPPFGGLISFDASDAMIPQATSARDPESCANHIERFGDADGWRPRAEIVRHRCKALSGRDDETQFMFQPSHRTMMRT